VQAQARVQGLQPPHGPHHSFQTLHSHLLLHPENADWPHQVPLILGSTSSRKTVRAKKLLQVQISIWRKYFTMCCLELEPCCEFVSTFGKSCAILCCSLSCISKILCRSTRFSLSAFWHAKTCIWSFVDVYAFSPGVPMSWGVGPRPKQRTRPLGSFTPQTVAKASPCWIVLSFNSG
jgi:hypothetical protein